MIRDANGDWGTVVYDATDPRRATFSRAASQSSVFNPVTGEFDGSSSVSGDSEVTVIGHEVNEIPAEKNRFERNLETIFVDEGQGAGGSSSESSPSLPVTNSIYGDTTLPSLAHRETWNPTLPIDNIFGIRPPQVGDRVYSYQTFGSACQCPRDIRPSLTINFDYGNGYFDPITPWSNAFGPYWGGSYQCVMNDHVLWRSAHMTEDQWRHAAEILRDSYPRRIGTVQIVGHGGSYYAGPFSSSNIEGGRLQFLHQLASMTPDNVYLRTCWSGGNHELLQQLSNLLDADVYAGDGWYAIINWGNWWVAHPNNGGVEEVR